MIRSTRSRKRCRGFTLIEAMFLMTIMAIIALAAGVALQSLARVPQKNDDQLAISNALVDKLEQLRGTPFANLAVGTALSDSVTINKITYPRNVNVVVADAALGGTPDADFKQITVTIGPRSLSCYVTQP